MVSAYLNQIKRGRLLEIVVQIPLCIVHENLQLLFAQRKVSAVSDEVGDGLEADHEQLKVVALVVGLASVGAGQRCRAGIGLQQNEQLARDLPAEGGQ